MGAGGHARICADVVAAQGDELVGFVSASGGVAEWAADRWLGEDQDVDRIAGELSVDRVCVAIGDNAARMRWTERLDAAGLAAVDLVSPSALVAPSATLGAGAQVLPGAIVNPGAVVGDGVILNTGCIVEHDCRVGSYAHVAPGAVLAGSVAVGGGTLVGIGARIVPGVRVGADCVVGAGAVVLSDVADGITVVGVPAREVRR